MTVEPVLVASSSLAAQLLLCEGHLGLAEVGSQALRVSRALLRTPHHCKRSSRVSAIKRWRNVVMLRLWSWKSANVQLVFRSFKSLDSKNVQTQGLDLADSIGDRLGVKRKKIWFRIENCKSNGSQIHCMILPRGCFGTRDLRAEWVSGSRAWTCSYANRSPWARAWRSAWCSCGERSGSTAERSSLPPRDTSRKIACCLEQNKKWRNSHC